MKTITFQIKKLGNHWYPDIEHFDPNDLSLDPKMEYFLDKIDVSKIGNLTICLLEQEDIITSKYIVQFEESDLVRYLTTSEDFYLTIYIKDHPFYITSELFTLLEEAFDLNFSQKVYTIQYIC